MPKARSFAVFVAGAEVELEVVEDVADDRNDRLVGLRYQNAKSALTVAGEPLPVRTAGSRASSG